MSKKRLDIFDVDTVLKQMAGKAVPAAMTGYMLRNAGSGCTFLEILIDAVLIKISSGPRAREKNISWSAALKPVFGQQIEVAVREDCISVPSALAFADMNSSVGAGYITIMKMYDFRHSQAGRIHGGDDRFVFKVRRMINNALYFIP